MRVIILLLFIINLLFSQCPNVPTSDTIDGFAYQGMTGNKADCKQMYNDNGDGLGYYFTWLSLDYTCSGFCYFNTKDSTGNTTPDTPSDDSDTPSTTGDGTGDKISDLIPYLDEVESINIEIANKLDNVKNDINTGIDTLNTNTQTINNSLGNVDTTLNKLNSTLGDVNSTLGNLNNNPSDGTEDDSKYDGIADLLVVDPSIDTELTSFKTNVESSITNSFNSYSNVFGLGGYGSAPSNITFTLLGKTYTLFDIKLISPYLEQIRKIFLITAYLFGIFLVFKGV